MEFLTGKKEYEETKDRKGTYHYLVDVNGWGDTSGYIDQGLAAIAELDHRNWEWTECDDDECFEYYQVVFLPYDEDLEEELEKLNEQED